MRHVVCNLHCIIIGSEEEFHKLLLFTDYICEFLTRGRGGEGVITLTALQSANAFRSFKLHFPIAVVNLRFRLLKPVDRPSSRQTWRKDSEV